MRSPQIGHGGDHDPEQRPREVCNAGRGAVPGHAGRTGTGVLPEVAALGDEVVLSPAGSWWSVVTRSGGPSRPARRTCARSRC